MAWGLARRVSTSRSRRLRSRRTGSWLRRFLAMLSRPMGRRALRLLWRSASPFGGIPRGSFSALSPTLSRWRGRGGITFEILCSSSGAGRLLQDLRPPTRRCAPTSPASGEVNLAGDLYDWRHPPTRRFAPSSPASGEVRTALLPPIRRFAPTSPPSGEVKTALLPPPRPFAPTSPASGEVNLFLPLPPRSPPPFPPPCY